MKYARSAIVSIVTVGCMLGTAWAQKLQVEPAAAQPPAQSAPAQQGGIQSQNIFEVKPDASADPNYTKQSNAERAKVQVAGCDGCYGRQVGRRTAAMRVE